MKPSKGPELFRQILTGFRIKSVSAQRLFSSTRLEEPAPLDSFLPKFESMCFRSHDLGIACVVEIPALLGCREFFANALPILPEFSNQCAHVFALIALVMKAHFRCAHQRSSFNAPMSLARRCKTCPIPLI